LSNVVAVGAGEYTSAALRADGAVVCWGSSDQGFTNVPPGLSNVVAIAAGFYHVLALHRDGSLSTWGSSVAIPPGLSNVVSISAGYQFSMALLADGTTVGWGVDWNGQVSGATSRSNLVAVAAGAEHVLGLSSEGTVLGWGSNNHGETDIPAGLTNVVSVSAGGSDGLNHSLALIGGGPASPPPTLAIQRDNGGVRITIAGHPRTHYIIECTEQLGVGANWSFNQNVFLLDSSQVCIDSSVGGASRFYRARFIP